jgi:hypothetical protein
VPPKRQLQPERYAPFFEIVKKVKNIDKILKVCNNLLGVFQ